MQDAVAIMYLKELPFTKLNFYDHIPTIFQNCPVVGILTVIMFWFDKTTYLKIYTDNVVQN